MQLLDHYLKSVGNYLPAAQKEDILQELSENIRSQMEDKESELGRPLNEAEQEAILKQHGNPLIVAGRYRQDHRTVAFGRQFIGPVLFPFYIKVLSFNLGITFVVLATIFTALFAAGQRLTFREIAFNFFLQLFIQMGAVTVIFSLVESYMTKYPDRWNPRRVHNDPTQLNLKIDLKIKNRSRIPRLESFSQWVFGAIGILWFRTVLHNPYLLFGPAASFLKLGPIWHKVYAPIILLGVAGMVQATINLARPDLVKFRLIARSVIGVASFAVVIVLRYAGEWVVLTEAAAAHAEQYRKVLDIVNRGFLIMLWIAALICAVQFVLDLVRLFREPAQPSPVSGASTARS